MKKNNKKSREFRFRPLRRRKRPPPSPQSSPQKIYKKQMPRKSEKKKKDPVFSKIFMFSAAPLPGARVNGRPVRTPVSSAKSPKKPKIAEQKDPEFLEKLFGIGAKKVE